jgi:hypothetical protein
MLVRLVLLIAIVAALTAAGYAHFAAKRRKPVERMSSEDVGARLDDFWRWWRRAAPRLAVAVDTGQADSIVSEVGDHVHAIDTRLAWETGPGLKGARHHLALSPEGDIELRVLTERWLSRAPPADDKWEYYPARQAFQRPGMNLVDADGVIIDVASVRIGFEIDATREVLNVNFSHPAFEKLDEPQRARAAFLTLDNLLGEDGVERWLGAITTSVDLLPGGKPVEALTAAVDSLRTAATAERFVIANWKTRDGQPMVATVNLALKRIDHLLMDYHLTIGMKLLDPTPQGLTTNEEARVVNALEDELTALLGHDAVYIGRETGEGRRTLHFHVAGAGPAELRARTWAKRHPERGIEIAFKHDPQWEVLRRWR